jgi:perosamine synthetase
MCAVRLPRTRRRPWRTPPARRWRSTGLIEAATNDLSMSVEIPLSRPSFDEQELRELESVLASGWVSQGPKVREFEETVAGYLGARHAIAVTNCTAALHLALLGLGVGSGDEVLVADYTFPATGHAVLYCGAKPVFVDIDPTTYNIDPAAIEARITPRTKGIVPVHTFGQPARMDAILEFADERDLFVVEDAACALGARYQDTPAGTLGDAGCFSFHARKGVTTGEGGMIVTDDADLAARMRHLSVFGMETAWSREGRAGFSIPKFTNLGYNYKMSDIAAAVGVAQMGKIDGFIARRRSLAEYWDHRLAELDLISAPRIDPNAFTVYQSYVAVLDRGVDRNRVIDKLLKAGIQTQIGTYASHIQPVYAAAESCEHSLDIYNRAISLPMFVTLSTDAIDHVVAELDESLRSCHESEE